MAAIFLFAHPVVDTHPSFTHPHRECVGGCQFVESTDTWLAKLLLSFYKTEPERPLAACEPAAEEMVQVEQTDEPAQKPQVAQNVV